MFAKKWTLYSPIFDSIFFFAPFVVAIIFVKISELYFPSILYPETSPLWFFIFAIVFDVGHVWWTLYRWYLQKNIFSKHWRLLIGVPILSFIILVILSNITLAWYDPYYVPLAFLAHIALYHFIKQQVGFVLLYDKRSENLGSMEYASRKADTIITWIVTSFPFFYWMMHYELITLNWFTAWEYTILSSIIPRTELIWIIYAIWCILYAVFQILLTFRWAHINPLKYLYIFGTAYIWYTWMVAYDSIIIFGFGNMLLHGLNYYGLIIGSTYHSNNYGKWLEQLRRLGIWIFSTTIIFSLFLFGYIEEFFWNQFIWQEKTIIFSDFFYNIWYNQFILIIIFSILGSIQLTHYILDRYIWRWEFWKIY